MTVLIPGEAAATPVYIAIGANLGNPVQQVMAAVDAMELLPGITVTGCSSLYVSPPMGPQDQPDYTNAVCKLDCSGMEPLELLDHLQAVESEAGRQRDADGVNAHGRWGPRQLDLDMLLFGQQQVSTARLSVPHPGILERPFVLLPLLEVEPDIQIPGRGYARDYLGMLPAHQLQRVPESALPEPRA